MLKKYDPLADFLEYEEVNQWMRMPMRYVASCLLDELGYADEEELEVALNRTFDVCYHMHIPITHHFRRVYISKDAELKTDWQLSDLGLYLMLVNGNARNPHVARAQVFFLKKLFGGGHAPVTEPSHHSVAF